MNLFDFWYFNKILLFKQACYSGFYFKCLKCKTNWNESQSKANDLIWNARKHIEYNRMISNPSKNLFSIWSKMWLKSLVTSSKSDFQPREITGSILGGDRILTENSKHVLSFGWLYITWSVVSRFKNISNDRRRCELISWWHGHRLR